MSSWEDDDYNPPALGNTGDTTPQNWDDEKPKKVANENLEKGSEPKLEQAEKPTEIKNELKKPKKKVAKIIKTKEETPLPDDEKDIGIEDPLAEKLRLERKQKESDMKLTREVFDGVTEVPSSITTLEAYKPVDDKEFEKFSDALAAKITQFDQSFHYLTFLKSLLKKSVANLKSDDTKDLIAHLTVLQNEKLQKEKDKKKKKSSSKKNLAVKDDPQEEDVVYDEYDFM